MHYVGYHPDVIESARAVWAADGLQALIGDQRVHAVGSDDLPEPQLRAQLAPGRRRGTRGAVHLGAPVAAGAAPARPRCCRGSRSPPTRPQAFKDDSYRAYLMCFGSSGMFEQDDVENWASITTTAHGSMARRLLLNSRMGLRHDGTAIVAQYPDFAGPGIARQGFGEHNQRYFLSMWADAITIPPPKIAPVSFGARRDQT